MKYLTKSLFTHALDCPTKLYYKVHPEQYVTSQDDNDFLKALAEGGIQVGQLAQLYFPRGIEISYSRDKAASLRQTSEYLKQDQVTLFEAAISHKSTYALIDILVKKGNVIELIEVKSKSWPPRDNESILLGDGTIRSGWQKYFYDVAFQTWVMKQAYPEFEIRPKLMLINKETPASIEGLHQYFKILKDENGRSMVVFSVRPDEIDPGVPIMIQLDATEQVQLIFDGTARAPQSPLEEQGFEAWVTGLCDLIHRDEKFPVRLGAKCRGCEHRVKPEKLETNTCGFRECWKEALGWSEADFDEPHAFDVWYPDSKGFMEHGIYKMKELTPHFYGRSGKEVYNQENWGRKDRQVVQIMKTTGRHSKEEVILPGLYKQMESWTYPLNFVDFEGVAPAIPFHKGTYPYKKTPFQFSLHKVHEDGRVEHSDEWIARERGAYPCFEFVRALKYALEKDKGSIFMYHHYERSTLKDVRAALEASHEPDRHELIEWIGTLVEEGAPREFIDQQVLIKNYHYSVHMGGSISIKDVLPAVLSESNFLKEYYSKPYNGLSIHEAVLYEEDSLGNVINPYKKLPTIGYEIPDPDDADALLEQMEESRIADGGTAMMAWARMQFHDVPEKERQAVFNALLRYCELDTLAMVMIYQHWKSKKEGSV